MPSHSSVLLPLSVTVPTFSNVAALPIQVLQLLGTVPNTEVIPPTTDDSTEVLHYFLQWVTQPFSGRDLTDFAPH
jgi:hypothetical protein